MASLHVFAIFAPLLIGAAIGALVSLGMAAVAPSRARFEGAGSDASVTHTGPGGDDSISADALRITLGLMLTCAAIGGVTTWLVERGGDASVAPQRVSDILVGAVTGTIVGALLAAPVVLSLVIVRRAQRRT